jgi:hypothetical protein
MEAAVDGAVLDCPSLLSFFYSVKLKAERFLSVFEIGMPDEARRPELSGSRPSWSSSSYKKK